MQTAAPDTAYEAKVLRSVIEQFEDVERTARTQRRLSAGALALGSVSATCAFFLAINALAHPVIVGFVAAFGGCALGFGSMMSFVKKQWPITRQYVDLDRVRQRLKALETARSGARES